MLSGIVSAIKEIATCCKDTRSHTRTRIAPVVIAKTPSIDARFTKWRSALDDEVLKSPCVQVPIPDDTLLVRIMRSLKEHALKNPGKPAVIDGYHHDRWLTFEQIHDQVCFNTNISHKSWFYALSFASFLIARGIKAGDSVTIVLPNSIEWPVVHLGTWAMGAVVIGSCPAGNPAESVYQWNDSGTSVIVTNEQMVDSVVRASKQCSTIKTIVCVRSSERPLPDGVIDYEETMKHPQLKNVVEASMDTVNLIVYSSGTTGEPKGVLHTNRSTHCIVETIRSHFQNELYPVLDGSDHDCKESFIITTSCMHVFGFAVLNWCLIGGFETVLMPAFDGSIYVDAVDKFKPRILLLTPLVFAYLAKEARQSALESVRMIICAAAPLRQQLCDAFRGRHPTVQYIVQAYGMSEVGGSHLPLILEEGVNASGGMVTSFFEQKIIDPDSLRPSKRGQWGEVCLRGPGQTIGYLNKPDATKELIDEQGWLHTGDIGYVDERGFLFIVDRKKELITVNFGNEKKKVYQGPMKFAFKQHSQVSPAEIEGILISSSRIRDAAIIGVSDGTDGELIRAFVVRVDPSMTEEDVQNLVSEKLDAFKHISAGVFFLEAIPRNSAIGKIQRYLLKEISAA